MLFSLRLKSWVTFIPYLRKWSTTCIENLTFDYIRWWFEFVLHQNINTLFPTVNVKLEKIEQWFKPNKLSLNIKNLSTLYFINVLLDVIPLKLPDLKIENRNIKSNSSINFLGVILDEHLSWRNHIGTVESKIAEKRCLIISS